MKKERWTLEMSEGAQRQGDSLATLFKAKEGLPSGQGLGGGILNSPGNKLTGIPSPALLVAASLRLSTPILQSTGLTPGPGWDSGCVCARAKEQLQGCDRGSERCEREVGVLRATDAPERGTSVERELKCFSTFHYRSPCQKINKQPGLGEAKCDKTRQATRNV